MNIGHFKQYREENFGTAEWSTIIQDKRKRPQIKGFEVVESILHMPVFGQKSFLEVDEFLKTREACLFYGSKRASVASDTTLERVVESLADSSLKMLSHDIVDKGDEQALWDLKLPSGKKLRLGIVDGHYAGRVWVSVLAVHGKSTGVVDLERYVGRGRELAASRSVLKRAFKHLGKGFFGIVAGDGLYASKTDFQLCLDQGSHLLVKTDEDGLTAIQDAQYLFACGHGVKSRGWDQNRKLDYETETIEGVKWQGFNLTVECVKERKEHESEWTRFWILTTAEGYAGEDLREIAHLRWRIENHVFKRLNQLVGSKRCYSHKPKVMVSLLRIWMMGLTLLGAYLNECGWGTKQNWESLKKTWHTVVRRMRASLVLFSG